MQDSIGGPELSDNMSESMADASKTTAVLHSESLSVSAISLA